MKTQLPTPSPSLKQDGSPDLQLEAALDSYPPNQLAPVLELNKEFINHKFWHGLSCLHKLCIRMDSPLAIIKLAIDLGGNVNARNTFQETPLMFAAKRGSLSIFKLLLENGADISLVDKTGRGIMHHAVMGGSIYFTHILSLVYHCDLQMADDRNQTPLHIAVSQSNLSMVKYLLRLDRTPTLLPDKFDNTALHYAAIHADTQIIWTLLAHYGPSSVNTLNKQGQSVIQCCEGMGSKHQQARLLLSQAQEETRRGRSRMPLPYAIWYFYMLLPLLMFVGGTSAANVLQSLMGGYSGGTFMLLVLLYTLYLFQTHSHRIKHHSRWPNPMFTGAFGAGIIGTFLSWACIIGPAQLYTHQPIVIFTLLLAPLTFYLFWKLLTGDPGFTSLPTKELVESPRMISALLELPPSEFCSSCDAVTGSTKHCRLCDRCVVHMDHHCLFLMKCVASSNHVTFVVFIIVTCIDIALFLYSSYFYFSDIVYPSAGDVLTMLDNIFIGNIFWFYLLLLNLGSLIWGLNVVRWQLKLISLGSTFYETLKSVDDNRSNSSDHDHGDETFTISDKILNVVQFFQGKKKPHKRTNPFFV